MNCHAFYLHYTWHMENLLEIHICFTNHTRRLPTKVDKCRYFGSGKFGFGQEKVMEMSGNFAFHNLWEPCLILTYFNIIKEVRCAPQDLQVL